jgi:hypothetical protein
MPETIDFLEAEKHAKEDGEGEYGIGDEGFEIL